MTRLGEVKLKFAPHPKVASYPRGRTSNERLLNLVRRAMRRESARVTTYPLLT
jgi:hypothetical protein